MATAIIALTKPWHHIQPDDTRLNAPPSYPVTLKLNQDPKLADFPSLQGPARTPQLVNMNVDGRLSLVTPEKVAVMDRRIANPVPPEEVCFECAMRDAEMADVDVTSPGMWDRESDVWYEELVRKEKEEERLCLPYPTNRPRAKGHVLTEHNLKMWLSMNPKEAAARDTTVRTYVRMQMRLLEAESQARSQAAQESQELADQMRNTYSALRRSAYEISPKRSSTDDEGVRIRVPRSASGSGFAELVGYSDDRSRKSKQATLLKSGMIVEKVNLQEEERARQRRNRSRQRTSSRVSALESVPHAPSMRSLSSSTRPLSIAGSINPQSRQTLPSVRSQSHSSAEASTPGDRGSKSPRFLNFRNWSAITSRSSLALSGSMIDMHVGLEQDQLTYPIPPLPQQQRYGGDAIDLSSAAPSLHDGDPWLASESLKGMPSTTLSSATTPRKRSKISKLLKIFGSSKDAATSGDDSRKTRSQVTAESGGTHNEEHTIPLAPPPPLSFLMNRARASSLSYVQNRLAPSSISLSSSSPRNGTGVSPLNTGSSGLSSPISSKFRDSASEDRDRAQIYTHDLEPPPSFIADSRRLSLYRVASESDILNSSGGSMAQILGMPVSKSMKRPPALPFHLPSFNHRASIYTVDKDLPPLPLETIDQHSTSDTIMGGAFMPPHPNQQAFPRSDAISDKQATVNIDLLHPPQFLSEARRQSFGGLSSRPVFQRSANLAPEVPTKSYFNEFGLSRRSLNRLDDGIHHYDNSCQDFKIQSNELKSDSRHNPTPTKRRSRFALSSLFDRKSHEKADTSSGYEAFQPDWTCYSSKTLSTDSVSLSRLPRASTTSRTTLGQLVEQDKDFVAYRYPSAHEQLDPL